MGTTRQFVIFADEARAALLRAVLPPPYVCVLSPQELVAATASGSALALVDVDLLDQLKPESIQSPIIGLLDHAPGEALRETLRRLHRNPWLAHVLSVPLLSTPHGPAHLENVLHRFSVGPEHGMLGTTGIGRTALLSSASKRMARFERIRDFYAKHGLPDRVVTQLIDVCEELVMNALYDAPLEAGYFTTAHRRDEDVTLPPEKACEISYGIEGEMAFLRVRDPFGALTRTRLLDVLDRCNSSDVELDESRGGAGLGLWRIFTAVNTLSITVVPGALTEFVVGIATKDARKLPRPGALHLYFAEAQEDPTLAMIPDGEGLVDNSVTLVLVA